MRKKSDQLKIFIKGYSDFSLSPAGVMSNFKHMTNYGVYFRIKNNIIITGRLFNSYSLNQNSIIDIISDNENKNNR